MASTSSETTTNAVPGTSRDVMSYSGHLDFKLEPSPEEFTITSLPYYFNMNNLVIPRSMSPAFFLKDWNRYQSAAFTIIPIDVPMLLISLSLGKLEQFYKKVIDWQYFHSFHLGFTGVTWWNERIFVAISGFRSPEKHYDPNHSGNLALRVEVRSPSQDLLSVIRGNSTAWLKDLFQCQFTYLDDSSQTNGFPNLISAITPLTELLASPRGTGRHDDIVDAWSAIKESETLLDTSS